jgi:hypothetical protein
MNPETPIMASIQLEASRAGARLFRNHVGTYQLKDGRWLSSGLAVGSSDLIGWLPLRVTHDMVGSTLAVFLAVEVKVPGNTATTEQQLFIDAVRRHGGIAFTATSPADFLKGIPCPSISPSKTSTPASSPTPKDS